MIIIIITINIINVILSYLVRQTCRMDSICRSPDLVAIVFLPTYLAMLAEAVSLLHVVGYGADHSIRGHGIAQLKF